MLVAKAYRALFVLHMDGVLRTVVQAGVANLAPIRKTHLITDRDVVRGADLRADTASDTLIPSYKV